MNLWPLELFEFRQRHLQSDAHRLILAIGEVELLVQERYGIDPTAELVTEDVKQFAFLTLARIYSESDETTQKLDLALSALLKGRLAS